MNLQTGQGYNWFRGPLLGIQEILDSHASPTCFRARRILSGLLGHFRGRINLT